MKIKNIIFILLISFLLDACHSSERVQAGNRNEPPVYFLLFKISNFNYESSNLVIKEQIKVREKIKPDHYPMVPSGSVIKVDFYNKNGITQSVSIPHPLHKQVEYVNDSGILAVKAVNLQEAEFFVRVQCTRGEEQVVVFEKLSGTEWTQLNKINLTR